MKVLRNESDRKNQEYWSFVEKTSREVDSWPAWKKGQIEASGDKERQGATRSEKKK
jgi:hypothetical protein